MSETDFARISRAHGDPYRILNVDRSATTDEVRAAYKRLPDRIKLPRNDGQDGRQAVMNSELKDMAAQTFKQIATACATLVDPARRAEYDRAQGSGGALVPYEAPAPHAQSSGRYHDDYDLPSSHYRDQYQFDQPPRRSNSAAAGYGHAARPPYAEPPPYAPPRGREYDMYDDFSVYGERKHQPRRGGLEDDLFANPFGAFGGSGGDMFDLGLNGNGNRSQQSQQQSPMSDPFSLFRGFLDGMGGNGNGNGNMSMSPESNEDPLSKMFSQLSANGSGDRNGAGSPRGAFATHRVTRRHTNRHGETTISRQERTMAMMDAGPRGQVMMESSFKVVGRGNSVSGPPSLGGNGDPRSFSSADDFDLPSRQQQQQPQQRRLSSTTGTGYDRPALVGPPTPFWQPQRPQRPMIDISSPSSRYPAIEPKDYALRAISGPPGNSLQPYERSGALSRY